MDLPLQNKSTLSVAPKQRFNYSAPKEVYDDFEETEENTEAHQSEKDKKIISKRESQYQSRRLNRALPPERADHFTTTTEKETSGVEYNKIMRETLLLKEEQELNKMISIKRTELKDTAQLPKKKRKWDVSSPPKEDESDGSSSRTETTLIKDESSSWEDDSSRTASHWDETPKVTNSETPKRNISRWDQTPQILKNDQTPGNTAGFATPTPGNVKGFMTPGTPGVRSQMEMESRNRPLTDEELDELMPKNGYRILEPPLTYIPIRTPARKLTATPTPYAGTQGFSIQETQNIEIEPEIPTDIPGVGTLPFFRQDDMQYFGKLLQPGLIEKQDELDIEELKEIKIMQLLLKIKNGTPQMRKNALKHLTNNARELGASNLFNQILPLLMSPSLEEQERHLLVKVIDRIMFQLDDLVRPFTHKILVVIEPMLIDEDLYARIEGREIISNLSKAVGLATMISTMRPDIDHVDEYVRNTTSRAFSVVASALGIPALLPFLKAVCKSKKSWQARHTGIKIIQQISILMGCAVLPHLKKIVDIIYSSLEDEQLKVRIMTALCISALAEASYPYGIEAFEPVLKPLWTGIRKHRGKGLAAFLKAIGYIIPLMDPENANYYTKEVMIILKREFQSPDDEMKKIVLKVIKQCCDTEGISQKYLEKEVLPDFFKHFWVRRMALDRRNYRQLVETTVELAKKVGGGSVVSKIVSDIKDESEPYRKMVLETIEKIFLELGSADIDERLEQILIDGVFYAYQEQSSDDFVVLRGVGSIFNSLGLKAKTHLPQACSLIQWRLDNRSSRVRQQSADLTSKLASVLHLCNEEKLMSKLALALYECLGEEYPEVLGSILSALKAIVSVIGVSSMTPPIKDLLPRLTPILKNRHEKVQECSIELVGTIAERGAEFVSAREWMRICFDMLEMFKAQKKSIRRNAMHTFGYIAKAIGPQDVLATLLNNLKVQERQNRLCTTIAIAIVAEQCQPFTVLPALMNEYRVPELNVQNGVLKSMSFVFEYVGEIGKDYVNSVTPLLEDALMDRDLVHRQIACSTIKHVSLCCFGSNNEETLLHLFNFVWPNIFETAPHIITAVREAIEGLCVSLGPARMLQYLLQGLFHPARKVREVYWRIYNSVYIYNPQALVPAYPKILNDGRNTYERYELEYVF